MEDRRLTSSRRFRKMRLPLLTDEKIMWYGKKEKKV